MNSDLDKTPGAFNGIYWNDTLLVSDPIKPYHIKESILSHKEVVEKKKQMDRNTNMNGPYKLDQLFVAEELASMQERKEYRETLVKAIEKYLPMPYDKFKKLDLDEQQRIIDEIKKRRNKNNRDKFQEKFDKLTEMDQKRLTKNKKNNKIEN